MLSVLPLVFFALADGGVAGTGGQGGGVAAGLQVVEQLVSGGELVVAGHAAQVHFLLEVVEGDK